MLIQDMIWAQEGSAFFQKLEHSLRTDFKTITLKITIAASKLEIQVFCEENIKEVQFLCFTEMSAEVHYEMQKLLL